MTAGIVRIDIFLDDDPTPFGSYRPPARFELDTTKLSDGPHRLIIKSTDYHGVASVREVKFVVHNGLGVNLDGLGPGDVVAGIVPIRVKAEGGAMGKLRARKAGEGSVWLPTWAWIVLLSIVAGLMFYLGGHGRSGPAVAEMSAAGSAAPVQLLPPGATLPTSQPVLEEDRAERAGFRWTDLGKRVYIKKCMVCHQADGEGLPGFIVSLRASPRLAALHPGDILDAILNGVTRGVDSRANMPGFARTLSDKQIAAVTNFIRTSWGNGASTITPDEVSAARQRQHISTKP